MESRMEKYYEENIDNYNRSKKNEELYKAVYNEVSNLDNIPIPDNSNEIDISDLKEIVTSREEYQKIKKIERTNSYQKEELELPTRSENKIYDINILLENAKNELNRTNSLPKKTTNDNFLTSLKEEQIPPTDDAMEISVPMNKANKEDDSLPLDILADLKGSDDTIVTDPIIKDEITMINKIKEGDTFYSGSFSFSKKDFDEEDDENFLAEEGHSKIRILLLVFGLILLAVAIYLLLIKYIL